MKRIIDGTPVDPETCRRIEERADRITEEIRRTRGIMDDDRCASASRRARHLLRPIFDS